MNKARTARAVIGAGYGDEGKGLMTDCLAALGGDVVVRTNGGTQAGHTVIDPVGRRHVFHHFGSGSLAGVPTHLSRHFVLHPLLFASEMETLASINACVRTSVDPRALVTTPWDMMLNQFVEMRRGGARHGSCGVGFGETIERSLVPELALSFGDLASAKYLRPTLEKIRLQWVPQRLAALGGGILGRQEIELVMNDAVLDRYLQDCEAMAASLSVLADADLSGHVIFEGAQGLMLDQDFGAFPYVTRSNTGLVNMAAVATEAGIETIETFYTTRAYVTRHGAGPMAHEGESMAAFSILDPTNIENPWQGRLRAAPLDANILKNAIENDIRRSEGKVHIVPKLVVTCLDQIEGEAPLFVDGNRIHLAASDLAAVAAQNIGIDLAAICYGPSRKSIKCLQKQIKA